MSQYSDNVVPHTLDVATTSAHPILQSAIFKADKQFDQLNSFYDTHSRFADYIPPSQSYILTVSPSAANEIINEPRLGFEKSQDPNDSSISLYHATFEIGASKYSLVIIGE